MTVTWVRRLSDGEEIVIEEGQGPHLGTFELDPREPLFDRRTRALSAGPPRADAPPAGERQE